MSWNCNYSRTKAQFGRSGYVPSTRAALFQCFNAKNNYHEAITQHSMCLFDAFA